MNEQLLAVVSLFGVGETNCSQGSVLAASCEVLYVRISHGSESFGFLS